MYGEWKHERMQSGRMNMKVCVYVEWKYDKMCTHAKYTYGTLKLEVFVCDSLYIESDGCRHTHTHTHTQIDEKVKTTMCLVLTWYCCDYLPNLQSVEYRGLPCSVQAKNENSQLLRAPQTGKQTREKPT